jgi:hypothetical protein
MKRGIVVVLTPSKRNLQHKVVNSFHTYLIYLDDVKRGIMVVLTHQPSKETFAMKVVVNHSHLSREVFDNIFLVLVFVTLFKFL